MFQRHVAPSQYQAVITYVSLQYHLKENVFYKALLAILCTFKNSENKFKNPAILHIIITLIKITIHKHRHWKFAMSFGVSGEFIFQQIELFQHVVGLFGQDDDKAQSVYRRQNADMYVPPMRSKPTIPVCQRHRPRPWTLWSIFKKKFLNYHVSGTTRGAFPLLTWR